MLYEMRQKLRKYLESEGIEVKRFVAILALVVLMMAGCGKSSSADEPAGADSQTMDNTDQIDREENEDISTEEAENILQEYLVSVNNWESNYVLEPFDSILGEIENEEMFRFETRYTDDTDEVGGRLIANYAITTDGERIFWYNPADDEWVQQIGNGVVDNTVLDQDTNAKNIIEAVLLGDAQFLYVSDGNTEAIGITDIPPLFDADDPYMKIWNFSVVDLDRDGEEEVILFVIGVAGDMGGKMILHQIGEWKELERLFFCAHEKC